jgi:hypothetical protein
MGHRDLGIYIGLYLVLNTAMVYHNVENYLLWFTMS